MFLSRSKLEEVIEVIDLAIRPVRMLQGEEAMWVAINKMKAEALEATSPKNRPWVEKRIGEVLAKHGLRPAPFH